MVFVVASLLGSPAQLPLVVVTDSPLMNPLLGTNWLDVINPRDFHRFTEIFVFRVTFLTAMSVAMFNGFQSKKKKKRVC